MADEAHIAREATELANSIEAVCFGAETISVYIALASVIGVAAAHADRPCLPELLDLIGRTAEFAFDKALKASGRESATQTTEPMRFSHRNWRGETSVRAVVPRRLHFGSTEWHPERQWLLTAFDVEKGEVRDFAVRDMRPVADKADSLLEASRHLVRSAAQTYRKRNGQIGSLEGEDGEASFIVPFDAFDALRIVLNTREDRVDG